MKKKSLLIMVIALITIVATMAVSFAAWSKLTADEDLSIEVGGRVSLTVTKTGGDGKALIPNGAVKSTTDAYIVKLGAIKATFGADKDATLASGTVINMIIKTDAVMNATDMTQETFFTYFNIIVKTGTDDSTIVKTITSVTEGQVAITITPGTEYAIYIEFKDAKNNDRFTDADALIINDKSALKLPLYFYTTV